MSQKVKDATSTTTNSTIAGDNGVGRMDLVVGAQTVQIGNVGIAEYWVVLENENFFICRRWSKQSKTDRRLR